MALIQRFTNPFVALLPDLSEVPVRRQAMGALIASVVLHLLLLIGVIAGTKLIPAPTMTFAKPEPRLQELELTLLPPPPEPLEFQIVRPEDLMPMMLSGGLTPSADAPDVAIFQSDANMKAGTERLGLGRDPIPSMDGKERPFTNFNSQDVLLGSARVTPFKEDISLDDPIRHGVAKSAEKPVEEKPPTPQEVALKSPALAPAPEATPSPRPEVARPTEDEIAFEKPKPTPGPITRVMPILRGRPMPVPEPTPPTPAPEQRQEMAKLEPPKTQEKPSKEEGYQEFREKTKVEGGLSEIGKPGVDAAKTPLGVYKKQVKDAIGSRWHYYLNKHRDLVGLGRVEMSYSITSTGKLVKVHLRSNSGNEALARVCERSLIEAEIGPPPEEAQPFMKNGMLEDTVSFLSYEF